MKCHLLRARAGCSQDAPWMTQTPQHPSDPGHLTLALSLIQTLPPTGGWAIGACPAGTGSLLPALTWGRDSKGARSREFPFLLSSKQDSGPYVSVSAA